MSHHPIFNNFPIIRLEEFTLRELSSDDAKNFFAYISNPLVNKYLSNDDLPKSIDAAREEMSYWARLFHLKHSVYWGIEDNATGNLIGTCGFNHWSRTHHRVEISYDLDSNYWGNGIMSMSLEKIIQLAIEEMQATRIQATVALDNFASIKLLDRLGFEKEGLLKHYGILHGVKTDFYMYGLIKNTYESRK
jgi:ribosomal-protein-alanine N-acetyltransferase